MSTLSDYELPLTPDQEHYLKKELLNIQLHREFNKISPTYHDITGLRRFGPPFWPFDPKKPPANKDDAIKASADLVDYYDAQFPMLRHFFTEFVMTFPFIEHYTRAHGDGLWVDKFQKFFEIWKSKQISNSNDRGELSKRKLVLQKFISFMLMLYNSSLVTLGDDIYFNKDATRNSYRKLGKVMPLELDLKEVLRQEDHFINGLAVNVCGVSQGREETKIKKITGFWSRSTTPKMSTFYQFIIQIKSNKSHDETFYVRRRYSDFVKFDHQLGRQFPGQDLPVLPSKLKISTEIEVAGVDDNDFQLSDNDSEIIPDQSLEEILGLEKKAAESVKMEGPEISTGQSSTTESFREVSVTKLPREKLRVALRGYISQLLRVSAVRNSPLFVEFVSAEKFSLPTEEELMDIEQRQKLDDLIVIQQVKFQQETVRFIGELQLTMNSLKDKVLNGSENTSIEDLDTGSGLIAVFREIGTADTIDKLSPYLRAFIDVAKIEVASTIYEILIANDNSMANLHIFKRLHMFFPYRFVATILRFTNPMQIAKKLIDLFTLQSPLTLGFGSGMSLLQMMFTGILNDDLKKLEKEIDLITEKVSSYDKKGKPLKLGTNSYALIIEKINEYLSAKDEIVIDIKETCREHNLDLPLGILMNNNGLETKINQNVLIAVVESYKSWVVFVRLNESHTDYDDNTDSAVFDKLSKSADLYVNIKAYFKSCLRKRDKDGMRELWEEPELVRLVKELISIFFEPLIKIFTKAQLYLYIPIVREFNSELIKLIDNYHNDYNSLMGKGNNVVMQFMSLLTKYQDHLYRFIHHLYISDLANPDGQVFQGLIEWFNKFVLLLNFVKKQKPELKMDLTKKVNDLLRSQKNLPEGDPRKIDKDKLIDQIIKIISDVQLKRKAYDKVLEEQSNGDGQLNEKDIFAADRKKVVTQNWQKINQNFNSIFEGEGGEAMKMTGLVGSDLDELNMEFLEDAEREKEDSIAVQLPSEQFLKVIGAKTKSEEANKSYIKSEEFEDVYDNSEILKLSDMFSEMVEKVIREIPKF
ncbi:unnamed protein product [Kuraishia capsulata CBS 1993]|uniref:PX domain-containing protein n=1 Tax=Kuraishia capsulata CBS 1993 TaxID=1382522 RepID=W6MKR5_9ASCO|nr:uncharacterized protein KUCA_T00002596001 [Kuraishia capsulata CBS 1993]CDK26623.1 unnamed protein product [Kuraishia capsulata CBS 1993]